MILKKKNPNTVVVCIPVKQFWVYSYYLFLLVSVLQFYKRANNVATLETPKGKV